MNNKKTILIVDDEQLNRTILDKILSDEYKVICTQNGQEALKVLEKNRTKVSAIVLDLLMPVMNGFEFLEAYGNSDILKNIPVVVSTGNYDAENETKCLELGAWDFIKKPYNPKIIKFRIKNAIDRSELNVLKELRYREQYDNLTGLYKKDKFYRVTREMLEQHSQDEFLFIRFDIYKFQLVNAFYGMEEGDRLLRYCASIIREIGREKMPATYGHMEADIFCICLKNEGRDQMKNCIESIRKRLNDYKKDYDITPVFGLYEIDDISLDINEMYDNANMASKKCKGNYIDNYAYYEEDMRAEIRKEQVITNNMNSALEQEQFVLYLQPKYSLHSNQIDGGEVLVRWLDPIQGMISPGDFIPVFERNGFIMKLDYYVWEHACQLLHKWIEEGKEPNPISVNISRVSLYNPRLVEIMEELTSMYQVPVNLFQLELTESAFTSNPKLMKDTMTRLQEKGFTILMDDFGSGYSSLNVLKDISVDILKIDMRFMSDCDQPGRSENILASVVRMAKWLHMPVIAEGVEKEKQVSFLRSIGCEYVQGFYFARPMPVVEYEKLAFSGNPKFQGHPESEMESGDSLWTDSSQMELLFSNMLQPVAVYEVRDSVIDILRVNEAYYDMFGYEDINRTADDLLDTVDAEHRASFLNAFEVVAATEQMTEVEYKRITADSKLIWVNMKLKYINKVGDKDVIFGSISDITAQKEVDIELRKYREAISTADREVQTILVVDDVEMNREVLASIFEEQYHILQAANGQEAMDILKKCHYAVDIILLDVVMPVMNGRAFLEKKREDADIMDIPVIIITADDSVEQQVNTLALGANDYIVKPFIPEVVSRRVSNVLESAKRIGQVLKSYREELNLANRDALTGLYNRGTAGKMIAKALSSQTGLQAMLLIDIDNFKQINDTYGHIAGDETIKIMADSLRKYFRKSDILARYGGDEFIVYMINPPSSDFVIRRCGEMVRYLKPEVSGEQKLEFSVGIAVAKEDDCSMMDLIERADVALYQAKKQGKNQFAVYEDK